MPKAYLSIFAVLLVLPVDAMAHHKPGHNPPGHQKQDRKLSPPELPFSIRRLEAGPEFVIRVPRQGLAALPPVDAVALDEWSFYQDPEFGFTIEVPTGAMKQLSDAPRGSRFRQVNGSGVLDVYGGANAARLAPDEISAELQQNPQIAEVTYRASGDQWVVLSGYYTRSDYEGDDLIFYAKFMFNEDRSHLSAFEISYPEGERETFDPIVERLEQTLSPPL